MYVKAVWYFICATSESIANIEYTQNFHLSTETTKSSRAKLLLLDRNNEKFLAHYFPFTTEATKSSCTLLTMHTINIHIFEVHFLKHSTYSLTQVKFIGVLICRTSKTAL